MLAAKWQANIVRRPYGPFVTAIIIRDQRKILIQIGPSQTEQSPLGDRELEFSAGLNPEHKADTLGCLFQAFLSSLEVLR